MIPPEAMGGAGAGGEDAGAAALAQAAQELAAEYGCTPEEILAAAEAELSGGGAEGGAPAGGAPDLGGGEAAPAPDKTAAVKESDEIKSLREKAAKFDELTAKQAAEEAEENQKRIVKKAVASALEKFMAERQAISPEKK